MNRSFGSKLFPLVLLCAIVLSFAACAQPAPTAAPQAAAPTEAPKAAEPTAAPAAAADATTAPAAAAPSKVFKLGVDGPFSGPGAKNGEEFKRSFQMAMEAINYTIGDYKIEPVWIDDQSDPAKGTAAYEQAIVQDKIQAGILNWNSSVAVALMELTAKYKIPHFFGFGATEVVNETFASDPEKYGYWMLKGWASPSKLTISYVDALEDAIAKGTYKPAQEDRRARRRGHGLGPQLPQGHQGPVRGQGLEDRRGRVLPHRPERVHSPDEQVQGSRSGRDGAVQRGDARVVCGHQAGGPGRTEEPDHRRRPRLGRQLVRADRQGLELRPGPDPATWPRTRPRPSPRRTKRSTATSRALRPRVWLTTARTSSSLWRTK